MYVENFGYLNLPNLKIQLNFSIVPPTLQPFSFGEKALNSGQSVLQPCSVIEGDHPLKLSWLYNGEIILPHMGISVINIGELSAILNIASVSDVHAGHYTCVAENIAGKTTHTSDLIINGTFIVNFYFYFSASENYFFFYYLFQFKLLLNFPSHFLLFDFYYPIDNIKIFSKVFSNTLSVSFFYNLN